MSFLTALRTSYALPSLPVAAPPCGGTGIEEWDEALADVFCRLCAFPSDRERLSELDRQVGVFERHAVIAERNGEFRLRDELVAVGAVLRGWRDELLADVSMRRVA